MYVAANGDVTHVNQKGTGEEAGNDGAQQPEQQQPAPEQPQEINMQQAAEIAASHVGGTVDTITAESDGDYGAAWDADVYSAEGEYTIYIRRDRGDNARGRSLQRNNNEIYTSTGPPGR